MMNEKIHQLL